MMVQQAQPLKPVPTVHVPAPKPQIQLGVNHATGTVTTQSQPVAPKTASPLETGSFVESKVLPASVSTEIGYRPPQAVPHFNPPG